MVVSRPLLSWRTAMKSKEFKDLMQRVAAALPALTPLQRERLAQVMDSAQQRQHLRSRRSSNTSPAVQPSDDRSSILSGYSAASILCELYRKHIIWNRTGSS